MNFSWKVCILLGALWCVLWIAYDAEENEPHDPRPIIEAEGAGLSFRMDGRVFSRTTKVRCIIRGNDTLLSKIESVELLFDNGRIVMPFHGSIGDFEVASGLSEKNFGDIGLPAGKDHEAEVRIHIRDSASIRLDSHVTIPIRNLRGKHHHKWKVLDYFFN